MSRKRVFCSRGGDGMTLVEVVVSLAILAVVLLALISALMTACRLDELTRERTLAMNALLEMEEIMRAYNFSNLYDAYSQGGFIGNQFTIEGLDGPAGAPAGAITFFTDETDASADAQMFGLPALDLDADTLFDNVDVSSGHILLPIKLDATWVGVKGRVSMNYYLLMADPDD